jgi:hypothetical protein
MSPHKIARQAKDDAECERLIAQHYGEANRDAARRMVALCRRLTDEQVGRLNYLYDQLNRHTDNLKKMTEEVRAELFARGLTASMEFGGPLLVAARAVEATAHEIDCIVNNRPHLDRPQLAPRAG